MKLDNTNDEPMFQLDIIIPTKIVTLKLHFRGVSCFRAYLHARVWLRKMVPVKAQTFSHTKSYF